MRVFTSLEEFVGEFDTIENVKIGNFKTLFAVFAAFSLSLLLCFLVDKGRRTLKKAIRKLLRKLKAMLAWLSGFVNFRDLWNRWKSFYLEKLTIGNFR